MTRYFKDTIYLLQNHVNCIKIWYKNRFKKELFEMYYKQILQNL